MEISIVPCLFTKIYYIVYINSKFIILCHHTDLHTERVAEHQYSPQQRAGLQPNHRANSIPSHPSTPQGTI